MKTYSFLTKDSFRVDVKASSPLAAFNKLKAIPYMAEQVTASYIEYDKDGFASVHAWKSIEGSQR